MLKAHFGTHLDRLVRRLFAPLLIVHPHWLSALGLLASGVAGALFVTGRLQAAALLIALGGLFDLLDGAAARHQGLDSPFGAFLDSTFDRLGELFIFSGIALHFVYQGETHHVAITLWAQGTALMISYIKARADAFGGNLRGGLLERGERLVLIGLGAFAGALEWVLLGVAILGSLTVACRFRLAYRMIGSQPGERE